MAFFSCFTCFKAANEDQEVLELDYAHQSLNDVPNEVFAFERTLEELVLECNNIRDLPRQLFHCHGLKSLQVSDNDLHVLPAAISSLSNLVELNVSKNVLTDIPDTIKQCKQLQVLEASVNPLQKIPEGCTQLLSITELYLNDTFLEFLPANFGRLSKLKVLELRENALNTLPKSLSRLACLERLDLGQNEVSEMPEVIGSLANLRELWIDGNRIKQLPSIIGNLKHLIHLDASVNHIDHVSDSIAGCKCLVDLDLSTNDLKTLPEAVGSLESLVTLKLDDNQLVEVPMTVGRMKNLEELVLSQNYLDALPPSIGLCRKLHTLNVDDNDIECLPKELGSCISLKILSAHGNRLTTLPAELDHISNLAVINLTANMIQHLPVSFMKLTKISAIWLSENQHKPLVQLNQDTDPDTGQKVLTNFMLPQQGQDQDQDNNGSESGSFHASVWEGERERRIHVRWTDQPDPDSGDQLNRPSSVSLRREPTPFPKEMRAMAKRVQNMRNKKAMMSSSEVPADVIQRKKNKEHRPRMQRKSSLDSAADHEHDMVEIKEAKVSKSNASPVVSEKHIKSVFKEEQLVKEQYELAQFEELEKALEITSNKSSCAATNTDKVSLRDSGVITPSEGETSPDQQENPMIVQSRNPSDPLPQAPPQSSNSKPVKAELVTNELDTAGSKQRPPPYHIAAAMSKHASDFGAIHRPSEGGEEHEYENQGIKGLERKSSFMSSDSSNLDSISESETSTAPSSLQTIVRAPMSHHDSSDILPSDISPPSTPLDNAKKNSDSELSHASNLRKVSEQLLLGNQHHPRSRQSFTGIPVMAKPGSNKTDLVQIKLASNLAGSELRPSSYAGPPNTLGLPMSSPPGGSSGLNQTLPMTSSTLPKQEDDHLQAARRASTTGIRPPPSQIPKLAADRRASIGTPPRSTPPPPPPSNGLLTTIEKAAHSDEEPTSPAILARPSSAMSSSKGSRIPSLSSTPTPQGNKPQPNYENVVAKGDVVSGIPPPRVLMSPSRMPSGDRISTAQFVAKQAMSKIPAKTNGNSSIRSPNPSKIPLPGHHH